MPAQTHEVPEDEPLDQNWPMIRAQPRSFFKAPLCTDLDLLESQVAFIGVPFDQGTLGRPGARYGPDAIRDAPRTYSYSDPFGDQTEAEGFFDIDAGGELLQGVTMADCGNIAVLPSEVLRNFDMLTQVVEKVVQRRSFPVIVGGDHAITFPAVRGLSNYSPLNIVHFDAHMDYSHDYGGVLYSHGSPRPTVPRAALFRAYKLGGHPLYPPEALRRLPKGWQPSNHNQSIS